MMYTPSSGIWQSVWIERVPSTYIADLSMTPDLDHDRLRLGVTLQGVAGDYGVEAIVKSGARVVQRQEIRGPTDIPVDHPRLWSPDDPFLYDLEMRLLKDGQLVDAVQSYFGMRHEVKNDPQMLPRIFLGRNGLVAATSSGDRWGHG